MVTYAADVFTPNDYPQFTYVERGEKRLEELLRDALRTPKQVISISGPSKSGKTVLTERVVGKDNLIVVSGAEVRTVSDLWDRALDWMGAPSSVSHQQSTEETNKLGGGISGSIQIPLVAKGGGDTSYSRAESESEHTVTVTGRYGLPQIVKEIADSDFAILIDDFHYMGRDVQAEAAKQIKTAAERGVRLLVASVPHRADDVVRSNPELRGRTINIDTSFWPVADLVKIAHLGFRRLNAQITDDDALRLAKEACGSPQIMQSMCLQACYALNLREASPTPRALDFTVPVFRQILETTALTTDYRSLIANMHQGPRPRGLERKEFKFTDGTEGDVYRCVLLAISHDPPIMGLSYAELMSRVHRVCVGDAPVGSSVREAARQIALFALNMYRNQRIIEFDDEAADTLSIVDPYWLFYLRSSTQLSALAKRRWR